MSFAVKAIRAIESRSGELLGLDDGARAAGVSRFHLARAFAANFDHGVTDAGPDYAGGAAIRVPVG